MPRGKYKRGNKAGSAWKGFSLNGSPTHLRARAADMVPAEPTMWECLLRELELTDDEVQRFLKEGVQASSLARVVDFVDRNAARRFVPEGVLRLLGVRLDFDASTLKGRARRVAGRAGRRVIREA